ncbi:MAG TPA: cytochrome C6 [Oscillatoriales bacterium UBA8482]|nr:MAG: cytochrome C6 [Oscillatoriales cyanobacterium CG2_30_40_61]HBW57214.1 cytochrome C6 [Oscillatoriales bacterium UBA8482]
MLNKQLTILFLTLTLILALFYPTALAANLETGAKIFEAQCVGCHAGGGNIVRRGKTLQKKALQRNHVDTIETISALVSNGKNNMSAYKDRLTEGEIQAVSAYVLEQAEKNWKN